MAQQRESNSEGYQRIIMLNDILTHVETSLLAILADPTQYKSTHLINKNINSNKSKHISLDLRSSNLPAKRQRKYVTFSLEAETDDNYRLFTGDLDQVMILPTESFGIIMPDTDCVKEVSYTKLSKIPKGYASFANSFDSVWQLDYYQTSSLLSSDHSQRVFGIKNRKGYVLYPFSYPNESRSQYRDRDNKEVTQNFAICSSVLEDSKLSNFWNIDISDFATITTYGSEESVKELLDIRKEPLTKTGQRKKVLHWVAGHRRNYKNKTVDIESHLRGLTEFELGGFAVNITQPTK